MMDKAFVGILLAAGTSSRFGSAKQLLPFGDTTLLGQTVRNANASTLDRVVVVLGRSSHKIGKSIQFDRAQVVDNKGFGSGCASSLLAGLSAAGDCEALMLLLADQPGVGQDIIDQVISAWRRDRSWMAVTSYRGVLGHPFVFSQESFSEVRKLKGDKAVWKLLELFPDRVVRVEIDTELPPDVDTPEDYELALSHWQAPLRRIDD